MFLQLAFICQRHEHKDFQGKCDKIHMYIDGDSVSTFIRKSGLVAEIKLQTLQQQQQWSPIQLQTRSTMPKAGK